MATQEVKRDNIRVMEHYRMDISLSLHCLCYCLFLRKSGNFTERVVNCPNSIHYIYAMMWVFFDFRNFVFWGTTTVGTKLSSTLSMKSCISAERKEASVPQHMQDTKIAIFYKGSQNECSNFRCISLVSIPGKLFIRLDPNAKSSCSQIFFKRDHFDFWQWGIIFIPIK